MTSRTPTITPLQTLIEPDADGYVPGACNIGPFEIRRRRAAGVLGFAVAAALLAALLAVGAPAAARLILVAPLAGGFIGWLQARRRWCVAFAFAGLANLSQDASGRRVVVDPAALQADRIVALRLVRDALVLAVPIAVIAALLPV